MTQSTLAEITMAQSIVEDRDPHAASPGLSKPAITGICLLVFCLGYPFSVWLLNAYRFGDQEHYANFWQAVLWAHPSQWGRLQVQYLSSSEPMYRAIIGIGTYYNFDRIAYLSVWNATLLTATAYALVKYKSSLLFFLLIFTNYYILVLLGPAERLKFAYLLLILSFCTDSAKWKVGLSALSVFAHTQAVVQFVSGAIYYVAGNRRKLFTSGFRTLAIVVGGLSLLAVAGYLVVNASGDVISQKAEFYGDQSQGIAEIVQWVIILICGVVVFDKRVQFVLGMLPMGLLTALYGGRINVATLAFFCALSLAQRKTAHPLVLAVMAYMSFKSIGFVTNVLETGQGF